MLSCENFCCEEVSEQRLIDGVELKLKKSTRFSFAKKERDRRKSIGEGNGILVSSLPEVSKGKNQKETTETKKRRDINSNGGSKSKSNIEISSREPPTSPPPKSPRNEGPAQSLIDKLFKVKKSHSQQFKEAAISGSHSHSLSQLKPDLSLTCGNSPPH